MSWTEERIKKLISLWCSGKSASAIAEELGEDITRNAVIGKIHRMGMMNRKQDDSIVIDTHKKKKVARPHHVNKPKPSVSHDHIHAASGAILANKESHIRVPVLNHSGFSVASSHEIMHNSPHKITSVLGLTDKTCKWPIGHPDEADFHFCGCQVQGSGPYCATHAAIAYTASPTIKIEKTVRQVLAPRKESHKEDLMGLY